MSRPGGLTARLPPPQEKPSASKYEALTFIASWLLENNPNKPRVVPDIPGAYDGEEEDDEADFQGVCPPRPLPATECPRPPFRPPCHLALLGIPILVAALPPLIVLRNALCARVANSTRRSWT